jgi:membrane protease YdiL (CAAX protease family)
MGSPVHLVINPDEPPWGLVAGFATWFASVALLLLMSLIFVIPYIFPHLMGGNQEALRDLLLTDKTAILLQILSTIPAHLLTLGVVWAVVTHFGKLPFWPTLGWSRSKHFGFWQSAGLALLMLGTGMLITKTLGGQETQLDKIISSSAAARYSTAFLATFTAPLVEEMVYRGVLYSALRRFLVRLNTAAGVAGAARVGTISAVFGVLLLFTLVHVPQYWPNYGVIIVIFILSLTLTLVRAYTGRLLPCFIIHLVFNGASSLLIVLEPYIEKMNPGGEQKAAFIMTLARAVGFFV